MDQQTLKTLLRYEPETGEFYWLPKAGMTSGKRAGTILRSGHRQIRIRGMKKGAHVLAWLYMTGCWPRKEIDHVNCIKDDNRFCNLREATRSQNVANTPARNSIGLKGVYRDGRRFRAQIRSGGKIRNIGTYDTPEAAHEAYEKAAMTIHGEFARTR